MRKRFAVGILFALLTAASSVVHTVRAEGTWTPMASTPDTGGFGLVYDGGDYLYAIVAGNLTRYSIPGNSWEILTSPPEPPLGWVGLAYAAGNIYLSTTSIVGQWFLRYNIALDTWTYLTSAGGGPVEYIGGDFLYANTLREIYFSPFFQRYSISGDGWDARADPPESWLHDLVYAGGDYLYAITLPDTFYRYSISGDSWETVADTPGDVGGASLAYDEGDYIYALRGPGFTEFWRYSISGNSWETMASTPADIYVSDSLAYAEGYIYALRGGDTTDFWRWQGEKKLEVKTDKDVYCLHEEVKISITNVGDVPLGLLSDPPLSILDEADNLVYPEIRFWLYTELGPGETVTYTWNQWNDFTDTFVPPGKYTAETYSELDLEASKTFEIIVYPPPPVGGYHIPINQSEVPTSIFDLLTPLMGIVSLITAVAVSIVYAKHRKKQQN
ncbi:MAG: hypothetical protein ACE5IF_01680 [Candidatus Bathyarchaeia archaeon]